MEALKMGRLEPVPIWGPLTAIMAGGPAWDGVVNTSFDNGKYSEIKALNSVKRWAGVGKTAIYGLYTMCTGRGGFSPCGTPPGWEYIMGPLPSLSPVRH